MTEAIKESLSRWREYNRLMDEGNLGPKEAGDILHDDDMVDLCDAYLAEHPADEDEPVTAEWLRAVGFSPIPFDTAMTIRIPDTDSNWLSIEEDGSCGVHGEVWEDDYLNIGAKCLVRGDVRLLCRALRIPLTEPRP